MMNVLNFMILLQLRNDEFETPTRTMEGLVFVMRSVRLLLVVQLLIIEIVLYNMVVRTWGVFWYIARFFARRRRGNRPVLINVPGADESASELLLSVEETANGSSVVREDKLGNAIRPSMLAPAVSPNTHYVFRAAS